MEYPQRRIRIAFFLLCSILAASSCRSDEEDEGTDDAGVFPIQTLTFAGQGVDLDAAAPWVVLAAKGEGMLLYDATHPHHLVEVGNVSLPLIYKAQVADDSILGFDTDQGLSTASIDSLSELSLNRTLSNIELHGYISDTAWMNHRLITANAATGLRSYQRSQELQLTESSSIQQIPTSAVTHLVTVETMMVVADSSGGIGVYEEIDGLLELRQWTTTPHKINDLACNHTQCFAASANDGIFVYNVGFDATPELIQQIEFKNSIDLVATVDSEIYVSYLGANEKFGIYGLSPSGEGRWQQRSQLTTKDVIRDIVTLGPALYVLQESGVLEIFLRDELP